MVAVPRYDFRWQTTYELLHPKRLPRGTELVTIAHYDNSSNNRFNPDPNREVFWGLQTTEEMMSVFFDFAVEARVDTDRIWKSN